MTNSRKIQDIRRNYKQKSFGVEDAELNPLDQFTVWFDEMTGSHLTEPTAFVLATADKSGKPSARALLLKGFDERGFVFYTNYESRKGNELEENNRAAMLFFWPELERQIRIEGFTEKLTKEESEKYFRTRPFKSKLGAWASDQSTVIKGRITIVMKFIKYMLKFHSGDIPIPPYWGGYILKPGNFEFWQGRANRLHDRVCYRKENDTWIIERLSP
ncbi:MAG: pyridoxamine 5'-phosphate oxidase [Ignavibacteriae bacterium]|nr:pyridoxamine 5'-phosphate oxidase [Ignavibacteriota bacterium]